MAFSVVMPALEMAQETGKLVAWRKAEGDRVIKGEPLLEIETDKAVLEVESPADGILAGVSEQAGAVVPVGKTIAWIVRPGEAPPSVVAAVRFFGPERRPNRRELPRQSFPRTDAHRAHRFRRKPAALPGSTELTSQACGDQGQVEKFSRPMF